MIQANTLAFRALTDSLPSLIWTARRDGTRDFVNAAWRRFTGAENPQAWESLVHPDDRRRTVDEWTRAIAELSPLESDYRVWNAETSRYRWVSATATFARVGDEELWIGTMIDIDERKRRELSHEFLAHAGVLLNQTLNIRDTFLQLSKLVLETMCDYSVFFIVEEGRVRRTAWIHRDPAKQSLLDEAISHGPDPNDPDWTVASALRGTAPVTWKRGEAMVRSFASTARYEQLVEQLNLTSFLTCPVRIGSTVYGALSLARTGEREHFDEFDVDTAMQLVDRAALSIANADLYQREHRIALSFQNAALPDAISRRDGVDIDAYYMAARSDARVGGDWYDTEVLPDGRVLLSIGDVSGSGLEAAVIMSMMRNAIRSVAHVYADPATIIEAAQRATERRLKDHFITAFVGVVDPVLGRLTYCNAGHMRPLLVSDEGVVEIGKSGLPAIVGFDERRVSHTIRLPDRCKLILYTDGLTEGAGAFLPGEDALHAYVGSEVFQRHPTAQTLYSAMLPNGARDDVAILIAHISIEDAASSTVRFPLTIDTAHDASAARDRICAALARACGLSGEAMENARLVIGELTANVARHARGNALAVIDKWNKYPVFHLVDRGQGFRFSNRLPPIFSETGRGLFIASALARRMEVLPDIDGGSHVLAVLGI